MKLLSQLVGSYIERISSDTDRMTIGEITMDRASLHDCGGRRSGADRRSKFITPYMDFTYSGTERRSENERRSGIDRRQDIRNKE